MATASAVVQVEGLPEVKELIEHLRRENEILRLSVATQRVIDFPAPMSCAALMCMICAEEKPWGVWSPMGAAVCIECRDKARGDWKFRFECMSAVLDETIAYVGRNVVCPYPYCGCDGARNCDAIRGPSSRATAQNIEGKINPAAAHDWCANAACTICNERERTS